MVNTKKFKCGFENDDVVTSDIYVSPSSGYSATVG